MSKKSNKKNTYQYEQCVKKVDTRGIDKCTFLPWSTWKKTAYLFLDSEMLNSNIVHLSSRVCV